MEPPPENPFKDTTMNFENSEVVDANGKLKFKKIFMNRKKASGMYRFFLMILFCNFYFWPKHPVFLIRHIDSENHFFMCMAQNVLHTWYFAIYNAAIAKEGVFGNAFITYCAQKIFVQSRRQ